MITNGDHQIIMVYSNDSNDNNEKHDSKNNLKHDNKSSNISHNE